MRIKSKVEFTADLVEVLPLLILIFWEFSIIYNGYLLQTSEIPRDPPVIFQKTMHRAAEPPVYCKDNASPNTLICSWESHQGNYLGEKFSELTG